ncbi:fungal Zn, 2-cys(6) binuclear cluster domain protein [Rhizoctonia solani AG-3 Rhs1AP]|uniref:Fungal Zn, 2-cys(6) binuclear cluster domain protein n=2 Tax=Rhizoctonia solani AG-3 TaxID=1086053 RepID=A0A074RIX4_9AGAM|nr:fungal Zn, 2-cys(6) binuclear cluster domain protein [Rhizoctonia solani AG-3 Rhs1AP]KEP47061.1 fungal Zn, 2-cys(6) binuclear cluster domain protein [Rhizoctonia solani 123E]
MDPQLAGSTSHSALPTTSDPSSHDDSQREKHRRTKTGCLTCKRRRKKCDETRPKCRNCVRICSDCAYGPSVSASGSDTLLGPVRTVNDRRAAKSHIRKQGPLS